MLDLVANKLEAVSGYFFMAAYATGKFFGFGKNQGVFPVYEFT